ncbi:hypothetical protein [Planctopirus ephydatiae]|nr:hypothetical protein [Planctopirus ephydatiae]
MFKSPILGTTGLASRIDTDRQLAMLHREDIQGIVEKSQLKAGRWPFVL